MNIVLLRQENMAIIKCKMCGGELKILPNSTICECQYCGSKQTIPNTDDEKRLKLYERANKLRFENEFDKKSFANNLLKIRKTIG